MINPSSNSVISAPNMFSCVDIAFSLSDSFILDLNALIILVLPLLKDSKVANIGTKCGNCEASILYLWF